MHQRMYVNVFKEQIKKCKKVFKKKKSRNVKKYLKIFFYVV